MRQFLNPAPGLRLPEIDAVEIAVRTLSADDYFYVPAPVRFSEERLHETYLRIYEMNLDDVPEIVQFVENHGRLGVARYSLPTPEHEYTVDYGEQGFDLKYFGDQTRLESLKPGLLEDPTPALREERSRITRADKPPNWDRSFTWSFETLSEFRYGAGLIKDMVGAWRWINEGFQPSADEWQLHSRWTKEEAAHVLRDLVDEGLACTPPGLALRGGLRAPWEPRAARAEEHVPLFAICCSQLANHILIGERYRRCAKTDCRKWFVRQEGGAKRGQKWARGETLAFCSRRCANTQAQRDRRGSKGSRGS